MPESSFCHNGQENLIRDLKDYEIEFSNKSIGKAVRALFDKYGRVIGIEIETVTNGSTSYLLIPSNWIRKLDCSNKKIFISIPITNKFID